MKTKGLNIGITFFWGDTYQNIWSNGAGQNLYFIKELLEQISFVKSVYFVYWDNNIQTLPAGLETDNMKVKIYPYEKVLHTTDILIEGTLTLDQPHEKAFREHDTKIVSFRMGNDFIMDMEKFIHGDDGGRVLNGTTYDSIWLSPHLANTNRDFLQIMTGTEVHIVPHLWSPFFLTHDSGVKEKGLHFGYVPGKKEKRIAVFEPNTSIMKNAYVPILIAEAAYKKDAKSIKHVYLCNTYEKRDLNSLHNFIGWTSLVQDNVMTVEARFVMPQFLSIYTDIMLSYQWELGLNYAYYEALYGGYPLVHNSPYLRDANVGYFYEGFDAIAGADALLEAIHHHDDNLEKYENASTAFLDTLSPYEKNNIAVYEGLLKSLYKQ